MSALEDLRSRILGGGVGAGILPSLQGRLAQITSPGSPQILKGSLMAELREKGLLGLVMARAEKFRAPPTAPAPPAAPEARVEKRRVSVESIEGLYSPRVPGYAGPLTYEVLSPNTKAWLTRETWAQLTEEEKVDAVAGAGLGYEALKHSIPWRGVEFIAPGKFQKGKIAVEG